MVSIKPYIHKIGYEALVLALPVLGVITSSPDYATASDDTKIKCEAADNTCLEVGPVSAEGELTIVIE